MSGTISPIAAAISSSGGISCKQAGYSTIHRTTAGFEGVDTFIIDTIDFYVKAAPEEELETLEIPELTDQTIVETVKEFTFSCAAGEISQEEPMKNINSKVQLYLSE